MRLKIPFRDAGKGSHRDAGKGSHQSRPAKLANWRSALGPASHILRRPAQNRTLIRLKIAMPPNGDRDRIYSGSGYVGGLRWRAVQPGTERSNQRRKQHHQTHDQQAINAQNNVQDHSLNQCREQSPRKRLDRSVSK